MPSDEISTLATADAGGPRHSSARRSLLKRLHMPVGKAIALAAMPSAALLGMGFTSPLAKAAPQPDSPFLGDSCVEVPDAELEEALAEEPEESEDPEKAEESEAAGESREPEEPEEPEESRAPEAAEESEDQERAEDAEETAEEAEEAEEAERAPEDTRDDPRQEGARTEEEPEDQEAAPESASPTEPEGDDVEATEETPDPRDPLGIGEGLEDIGEGLGDLLNPGGGDVGEDPPEEPEAPPQEPDEPDEPGEPERPEDEAPDPDPEDGAPEDGNENENENGNEAGDGERGSEEEREAADADPSEPDENGRVPLPCPIAGQVAGTDELTPLPLPNAAWYLEASSLTLHGLSYEGVVNVTTPNGTVKQALKFTADALDIGDLHQIVDAENGTRHHVGTDPGTVSTFRGGRVTMYTERLEGNLFGLIPTVYDPENQPPLDLPFAHFTDVSVTQAGQFGGTLTMQGMHIYTTNDGPTVP